MVAALFAAFSLERADAQATGTLRGSAVVQLVIETERGDIAVSLDSARAPVTVANFLRYVDGGFYTGGVFHRTVTPSNQPNDSVRIEVIQGGPNPQRQAGEWGRANEGARDLPDAAQDESRVGMPRTRERGRIDANQAAGGC